MLGEQTILEVNHDYRYLLSHPRDGLVYFPAQAGRSGFLTVLKLEGLIA